MPRFCENCGQPLNDGIRFCGNCGAPVLAPAPAPAPAQTAPPSPAAAKSPMKKLPPCPKCGGQLTVQTVVEDNPAGCGLILFYILLAVTILGLLILVPMLMRKKTETVTYAVCQSCGYRARVSS